MSTLSELPTWVIAALGLLALLEIVLDVVALVDLYRRPVNQIVAENKWVWLIVILLVNVIGAVVYLAAGRKPAPAVDGGVSPTPASWTPDSVADALYGPADEGTRLENGDGAR